MSNPLPSTGGVEISSIQLVNLPSGCSTYSVEISHDKKVKSKLQRKKVDGNRIVWFESLVFPSDLTEQSLLYFKVSKIFGLKTTVGSWKEKVTNLLQLQKDSGSCKFDFSGGCQLKFTIKQQDDILPQLVNEADSIPAATGTSTSAHPVEISNAVMNTHDTFSSQEDTWTPFLSQFGNFMNAIDTISEVHPYLKLAWGVLSVIPKVLGNLVINNLVQRLKEVYDYITDTNRLPTLKETQSKALPVLVQQTIECAYFLREYGESHIAKKILTGSSIDEKISDFDEKFTHILNVVTNSVALETSIVTLRMSNDISGLKKGVEETSKLFHMHLLTRPPNKLGLTLLGELPYAPDAGFSSSKCCLPGTRDSLITEILDWVNGNGSQQVLLLLGQAGRGKSAVAHTISQIFDIQNRLGAIFCFNRSYKDRRNLLFSTIARQLADGDVQWRESLAQIITKTSNRISSDIKTQFNELIIKPSMKVNTIGPVVIVIDGLDESGDRKERGERGGLLETLQQCSELPSNYRFIITSRPELDIEEWSKQSTFICKRMDDIDLGETTKDIQQYISFRFSCVRDILNKELDDGWSLLLARRAEGLFQWARTVCDFIDPTVKYGVAKGVKKFITGPTPSLYELYRQIFDEQSEFRNNDFLPEFKTIIGALIIMRKPPSIQALKSLFPEYDVKSIMQPFHSLFLGVYNLDTPIRPLHTSLPDFLTTRFIDIVDDKHDTKTKTTVENEFYINTSDQGYFTLACLKPMNSGLRFNICNLETSHKPNRDVLDLDDRIQAKIPWDLSYACYFWAIHLQKSEKHSNFSKSLLEQLCFLMRTNILYLFEVLGLLQDVEQMCISMNILAEWCEGVDNDLVKQAKATREFGYDFENIIMESTPHLYISALPFTRKDSFILKQYLDLFPHHLSIELDHSRDSLQNPTVIKRNTSFYVCAIAFSPRGRYIATGFESGELWLWNYRTGEIIHKLKKHKSRIMSIVFSPNGESVTACFRDARTQTWNIGRNEHVSADEVSIPGYTGYSTISNNGQYLVIDEFNDLSNTKQTPNSGRYRATYDRERTLLYDITTRSEPKQLACFSRSFPSRSIFSPNGNLLAFQSHKGVVSLWDNTAQSVIGSLNLFNQAYRMEFFPDGSRIGFRFETDIEIWDLQTKTRIRRFESQDLIHYNFAIFPDGQHLVFSSYRTTYIWNVSTGKLVQSFASEGTVTSFAVSPDCKHIASGRFDNTIWVQEWQSVSRTTDVRGHDDLSYTKARLSPGGGYLILEGWKGDRLERYFRILDTTTMRDFMEQVESGESKPIIAISPDDQYIASTVTNGLCLRSTVRGEVVLDGSDCYFTALAFSSNSDYLISGDRSGNVKVWNTHTCQSSKMMTSEAYIAALAFSAMGTQFLVVYLPNTDKLESMMEIRIHDHPSGKILKGPFICSRRPMDTFGRTGDDEQYVVAFSANESRIVCINPQQAVVFEAETGQILIKLKPAYSTETSLLLSPNRKYLLIEIMSPIGDQVILWNIDEGVKIQGEWSASRPDTIAFSNKPEEILTVSETSAIDFWNIGTGNKVMTRTFHSRLELIRNNPNVSSNEKCLVMVSKGSIKVWDLGGRGAYQAMSCVDENQAKVHWSDEGIRNQTSSMIDERERKEYALVAWQKALFSDSSEMNRDGWNLGPKGELLFCVPRKRQAGLWRPNMMLAAGPAPITRLGFNNFVHGSRWTECKKPLIS